MALIHERGGDSKSVDPAGHRADDLAFADLFPDGFDLVLDGSAHLVH